MKFLWRFWGVFCYFCFWAAVAVFVGLLALFVLSFFGFKTLDLFLKYNDAMDKFTIMTAFLTLGFVARNSWHNRKNQDEISIILHYKDENFKKELPIKILRKNFTRSEIFGCLGAVCKKDKFNIAYTKKPEFFAKIIEVQNKKADSLEIEILKSDEF